MQIYNPININEYLIYDIFYSDDNKLVIIVCGEIVYKIGNFDIIYIENENEKKFNMTVIHYPVKHVYIYTLDIEYKKNINIKINDKIFNTNVNRYPVFNDEIIYSTLVKNEDNYIRQWIDFHHRLGISRFIIYDNAEVNDNLSYTSIEKTSNLPELLKDYITNKIVILIKWPYPKRLPISGISGQVTQQNHSLYSFKKSKYIGFFDIDEYINIQTGKMTINKFFDNIIDKNKINLNLITAFTINNKFFYNPHNLPTDGTNFLKITDCDTKVLTNQRNKNFVIPKNTISYRIHGVTEGTIKGKTKGIKNIILNSKDIFFNHYIYLNKSKRGRENKNTNDESILLHLE